MLNYDKFYNIYGIGLEAREAAKDQYVLDEIQKRQEKLKDKDDAIANLQYERALISRDLISTICEDLDQSGFNIFRYFNSNEMFWEAWRYGNHHKDKDFEAYKDKEVKKKEKQSYEFVCSQIERLILKEDKEFERVDSVIDYSYSLCYEFTYKIRGHEIYVCIPNFKRADEKTYLELLSGYVIRYRESEYCIGWICSDIDYKKIYDKLMAWVNEHWPKEDNKMHEIDEETAKQLQEELMKNSKPTGVILDD